MKSVSVKLLDGTTWYVLFSNFAFWKFEQITGMSAMQGLNAGSMNFNTLFTLFHCAVIAGNKVEKAPPPPSELEDFIVECDLNGITLERITEIMQSQTAAQNATEKTPGAQKRGN